MLTFLIYEFYELSTFLVNDLSKTRLQVICVKKIATTANFSFRSCVLAVTISCPGLHFLIM